MERKIDEIWEMMDFEKVYVDLTIILADDECLKYKELVDFENLKLNDITHMWRTS